MLRLEFQLSLLRLEGLNSRFHIGILFLQLTLFIVSFIQKNVESLVRFLLGSPLLLEFHLFLATFVVAACLSILFDCKDSFPKVIVLALELIYLFMRLFFQLDGFVALHFHLMFLINELLCASLRETFFFELAPL